MSDEVRKMFAEIAGKYDLMDNILSLGIHHRWRKRAVRLSGARAGQRVLDCACGTGDLSFEFKNAVRHEGYVLGTDFCKEMVVIALEKAHKKKMNVDFEVDDATNLNQPDNRYDISSISFGIRNVDDPVKCLSEMARVVKPGGKVIVIEFGQPKGIIKFLYDFYSFTFMPIIGKMFANHKSAYQYLPETAAKFPCREDFLKLMEKSGGFSSSGYVTLSFGIAFIYFGTVK